MDKEKMFKGVMIACNILAILSGVMVAISMFMPYLNINIAGSVVESLGTGWNYLTDKSTSGRLLSYMVLCLIFAVALVVLGVLRLLRFKMFNSKILSFVFAGVGIMLLVFSVLTFANFNNSSTLDVTRNGAGLIVNLVFSIIAILSTLGSAAISVMFRD